jgi:hypothetical protein
MKAKDVPQDNSAHYEGHQRVCYATDESGRYGVVPSNGWETEVVVNALALADIRAEIEAARKRAVSGETSALDFHRVRCQLTVPMLAAETGIWRWRIRRHLRPDVFATLSPDLLERYARALRMRVDELKLIPAEPIA